MTGLPSPTVHVGQIILRLASSMELGLEYEVVTVSCAEVLSRKQTLCVLTQCSTSCEQQPIVIKDRVIVFLPRSLREYISIFWVIWHHVLKPWAILSATSRTCRHHLSPSSMENLVTKNMGLEHAYPSHLKDK